MFLNLPCGIAIKAADGWRYYVLQIESSLSIVLGTEKYLRVWHTYIQGEILEVKSRSIEKIKLFHRHLHSEIIVYGILPLCCDLLHGVSCRSFQCGIMSGLKSVGFWSLKDFRFSD